MPARSPDISNAIHSLFSEYDLFWRLVSHESHGRTRLIDRWIDLEAALGDEYDNTLKAWESIRKAMFRIRVCHTLRRLSEGFKQHPGSYLLFKRFMNAQTNVVVLVNNRYQLDCSLLAEKNGETF